MSAPGHIYYIACTETHRCKIGFTSGSVVKRLRALQTGSPTDLVIMAMHPGSLEAEHQLHEKFASANIRGEWFKASDDLIEHICTVAWLTAKQALASDMPVPEWAITGLRAMHEDIAPLPEELAALL